MSSRPSQDPVCAATPFAARLAPSLLLAWLTVLGCETPTADPSVRYREGSAIGTWAPSLRDPGAEDPAGFAGSMDEGTDAIAGTGADTTDPSGGGDPGVTEPPTGQAGQAGHAAPEAGSGGTSGLAGQGGGAGMDVVMMNDLGLNGLQFQVLTVTLNGKYSPKNVGAIWIETSSGKFVKTLEAWAARRARYLDRWRAEAASNTVDAVTSATLKSHVTHNASWDLTDVNGATVMAGEYKVVVEITDHDGPGDSTDVPFTLSDPVMTSPPDQTHFVNMALTVE